MRAYSAANEEALRARTLLKDWAGEKFLTPKQYQRMEQETVCEFRRTNIFLRLVMFFFAVTIVAACSAFFFFTLAGRSESLGLGLLLLFFAAVSYAAAEFAVSQGLYRYGIEEGLAVCSLALLCVGTYVIVDRPDGTEFLVSLIGALMSLWIWYRFGLAYAFLGAMLFVTWLSTSWVLSPAAQHVIIAAIYAAGLTTVIALRARHRADYLNKGYSIAEALLWLGIYLAFNLQLSAADLLWDWFDLRAGTDEFSKTFSWATYALIWIIPPAILYRGIRSKDRLVIAVGGITAILTLITNKLYLGWPRHTWDPMLVGALLAGVALFLNRWLANAPDGIRNGFTAKRLSGKDKQGMSLVSTAFGLAAPHTTTITPAPESHFGGGGESGGGGASGDF
jgi:hypothetical protein